MFKQYLHSIGARENRLIFRQRESSFGEHMKEFGKDLWDTNIAGKRGVFDRISGGVMAAVSTVLEGPDHVYDAALGREYIEPKGIAGRIMRDTGLLAKDIFTLHPLRALGDAWKLLTSDWILDAGDAITGNRLKTRSALAAI